MELRTNGVAWGTSRARLLGLAGGVIAPVGQDCEVNLRGGDDSLRIRFQSDTQSTRDFSVVKGGGGSNLLYSGKLPSRISFRRLVRGLRPEDTLQILIWHSQQRAASGVVDSGHFRTGVADALRDHSNGMNRGCQRPSTHTCSVNICRGLTHSERSA